MPIETRTLQASSAIAFGNGTEIVSPFDGQAAQWTAGAGRLRAVRLPAVDDPAWLTAALSDPDLGVREQEVVHVDMTSPVVAVTRLRGAAPPADHVVLRPAPPPPGDLQVVLFQDEAGSMSWHLPDGLRADLAAAQGRCVAVERLEAAATLDRPRLRTAAGGFTFTIPGRTAAAQAALRSQPSASPRLRSGASKLGRKVFRTLLLPVLGKVIEKPVEALVGAIERKYRQTLIRPLGPENFNTRITEPFTDWARLRDGHKPALLAVHGIFSDTEGALARLDRRVMERWRAHYGGRMIAFDHRTVTETPEQNARVFLTELARAGGDFDFDILCHSRGGIVSRILAEQALVPEAKCRIHRIFFVATPNQGSPLGDPAHMVEMLDVFTNLVNLLPDGQVLYSIEILLAIVKLLAYSFDTLPGVHAMDPHGYIATTLNRSTVKSPAAYAAAAANYEPKPGDLLFSVANAVLDRVFADAGRAVANDLVVPTEGVFAANGHPSFPIQDPLVYRPPADAIWHTELFGQARTIERIDRHFEIGGGSVSYQVGQQVSGPVVLGSGAPRLRSWRELAEAETLSAADYRPLHESLLREEEAEPAEPAVEVSRGGASAPPPAAGTAHDAAPAEEELRRNPSIDFHEVVPAGQEEELVVRLAAVEGGREAMLAIALPAGQEEVSVTVALSAPGFDVAPGRDQTMVVARRADPARERVVFRLKARNPGPAPASREIQADFWLGNACIGSVTHFTTVIPAGYEGTVESGRPGRSSAFGVPRVPRFDCDLVIRVESHDATGKPPFSIRLRSEIPEHEFDGLYVGDLDLPGNDLTQYFDRFQAGEFATYPDPEGRLSDADFAVAYEPWREAFMARLGDFGRALWDLLPKDFRDFYFQLVAEGVSPRSILVHSDETIFPWELVVPYAVVNGQLKVLEPLGVAHVMGRWRPGLRMLPSPQRLPVTTCCVLNPSYPAPNNLPWSLAEVQRLHQIVPGLTVVKPAGQADVRRLLARSDIQVLHFSGHGDYDAIADLNSIELEDGKLQAFQLAGTRLGAEAHPVLYLNACSVAKAGLVVGRMGGFAATCLTAGYSGVIAPYWPINDKRAADFSAALYTKLNQGHAIGEALQELREENPGDPTFHAFAYLGDPWTRLVFPLSAPGA